MYPELIHPEHKNDHKCSARTHQDLQEKLHPHNRNRRRRWSRHSICLCSALFLYLFSVYFVSVVDAAKASSGNRNSGVDRECNGIGNIMRSKGFTYPWWETSPGLMISTTGNTSATLSDDTAGSTGCPAGSTGPKGAKCCKSFDTTTQKNAVATMFNEKWVGPKLAVNAELFKERKKKFDVTFKDLLQRAHGSFHAMFERTYGLLYIQHAPIFHALFTTLETYYDTGRDSLEGKLNDFFAILTRKMFEVLNAQYDFDDSYLSCATIVVSEKQGGDLHRQIVSSLRRSFVATRALAQGLAEADRVLTNLQKIKVPSECLQSLSQMLQCPICAEQRAFKPCVPFCTSVTTKCLLSTASMNKPWTEFTNALEGILDRLLGPYNVEAVVEPIHIKISEAIMNFQESGTDLSQAVFTKCGKPQLKSSTRSFNRRDVKGSPLLTNSSNRKKEETEDHIDADDDDDDDTELMQADRHGDARGGGQHGRPEDTQPSKSLEKLLKEIKNKVRKTKTMWNVLPKQVCNGISKDFSSQLCWNGSATIKPDRNKTGEESEPGLPPGKGPPNLLVAEQVLILQLITDKLRASYNGLDVQWVQDVADDLEIDGSGNGGMGSGSGDSPDDLEDTDDDDPNGRVKEPRRPFPSHTPSTTTTTSNTPSRPKFPLRPAPPILSSNPHDDDDDDENDDEDDDEEEGSIRNWNMQPPNFQRPTAGGGSTSGSDLDFAPPSPPYQPPTPPKFNKPPPPMSPVVPFTIPTTVSTTTTTTTTRRPISPAGDSDVRKTTVSSGHGGDTNSAFAVFKVFSPIIVSMIGKVFSFS